MGNLSKTAIDAALKELYRGQKLQNLAFNKSARPLLSMLKKVQASGRHTPYPVLAEDSQGISAAFATAQTNITASVLESFEVSTVKSYSLGRIDTDALLMSANDRGAFIRGVQLNVDSAINGLANHLETHLFRSGTGAIGRCDASVTGTSLQLQTVKDINNFSLGMELQFSNADGGSVLTGTVTVTAIDRNDGEMTVDVLTAIDSTSGVTAGDYIYREGNAANGSTNVMLTGLEGWIPATAPGGSDSHFGVNRSADTVRYAGVRFDGTGSTFEEAIINGAAEVGEQGSGRPDVALMSFNTWKQLVNELGSKVERMPGGLGKAGYDAIQVYGSGGPIDCVPCTKCPGDVIWLLELSAWEFLSMEEPLRIIDDDGMRVQRVYNQDAFEVRIGSYSQLACTRPGHNARVTIS